MTYFVHEGNGVQTDPLLYCMIVIQRSGEGKFITKILKGASLFQLLSTSTTAYADGASISRGAR